MINTNQKDLTSDVLRIEQFNKNKIVNDNLASMIEFIKNDAATLNNRLFKKQIGVNQYNQIVIGEQVNQSSTIHNIKPARIGIKRNKDSIANWARRILVNYYQWLVKHAKLQQHLTPAEVNDLIKFNYGTVLFTPRAYIDWIISSINVIDFVIINSKYIAKDIQYFITQFCAHLPEYQYIKISNFTKIITTIADAIKDDKQKVQISPIFVHILLDMISNRNCQLPKIIREDDDKWIKMNYSSLINLCYNAHLSSIELPFSAIDQALTNTNIMKVVAKNSTNMSLLNIKFRAQDTADIISFFNEVSPEDGAPECSLEMLVATLKETQKHFSFSVEQSQKPLLFKKIKQLQIAPDRTIFDFSNKAQDMIIQLLTMITNQI